MRFLAVCYKTVRRLVCRHALGKVYLEEKRGR
jgi:hypothetical protein